MTINTITREETVALGGSGEESPEGQAVNDRLSSEDAASAAESSEANLPSDPAFAQQWHLDNTTLDQLDLNVASVWPSYSGEGVTAVVIDDGFDYTHPDFLPNYDTDLDYDFEEEDGDPFGDPIEDSHGTSTMGILGAAQNESAAVGVAYDVNLAGYRVFSFISNRFVTQIADAIETAAENGADLVSMSLSTQTSPNFFDRSLDPAAMAALQVAIDAAVDGGRDGLGTLLIKSAGNGRHVDPTHNANASSWNADFKTISVGATDAEGLVTFYSTPGANLLVSAFGSPVPGSVVTSDRVGDDGYQAGDVMTSFNGTSAAAPMVAGLVALILEANPELGWRDVHEILAASARRTDDTNPTWTWNGSDTWNLGGMHHSIDLGYGLIDAHAAVRLAEYWQGQNTTENLLSTTAGGPITPVDLPDADPTGLSFQLDVDATVGRVEYVTLRLDLPHTRAADLVITFTSPQGTTTTLLDTTAGLADHPDTWTYTASGFRGEVAEGTWTVTIVDQFLDRVGTLSHVSLEVWGSPPSNDDLYVFTEAFSDLAAGSGHGTSLDNSDGGRDGLNAAALTSDSSLDLEAGSGILDGIVISISGVEDLVTGDGDDSLLGNAADNQFYAGRGSDYLAGRSGLDSLYGGSGADSLFGGSGYDSLWGDSGSDFVAGDQGADSLFGGAGDDRLTGRRDSDQLYGGSGLDRLSGGAGDDSLLFGGSGDDALLAGDGNDRRLYGDQGSDRIYGGDGAERDLFGGLDDDWLYGGNGSDWLFGDAGIDSLAGGSGRDKLYGGSDGDRLVLGEAGNDFLVGDSGNDGFFQGGSGDDGLTGRAGDDGFFYGGSGADRVSGGAGDDYALFGGEGIDSLFGGLGDDTLNVADQSELEAGDYVDGGAGTDTLVLGTGVSLPGDVTVTSVESVLYLV
ncbi:MAG: S8 family serine peptidase [Pseudomonadota bacterium]